VTRTDAFKEVTRASRALADLAEKQRDTVDWWTQYGMEWQKLNEAILLTAPKKDTHQRAAIAAMKTASLATEMPR
jgi:hypothetical protein